MPETNLEPAFQKAWQLIKEYKRILIIVPPTATGDNVASSLALRAVIRRNGAEADIMAAEGAPERFNFLPDFEAVTSEFQNLDLIIKVDCQGTPVDKVSYNMVEDTLNLVVSPARGSFKLDDIAPSFGKPNYDLIITLQTDELASLGEVVGAFPTLFKDNPIINIDNRKSNTGFGLVSVLDPSCSSVTEIVFNMLKSNEVSIDSDIATTLLCGVIASTHSFQHRATSAVSFSVAGELIEKGGKLQDVIDSLYRTKSVGTLKLLGKALANLKHNDENSFVWTSISKQDLQQSNAKMEEAEGILGELISGVPDTRLSLVLHEYTPTSIKGEIATARALKASDVAKLFEGIGDSQTGFFFVEAPSFAEGENIIIEKISEFLGQNPPAQQESKASPVSQGPLTPEEIIEKIGKMMQQDSKPS